MTATSLTEIPRLEAPIGHPNTPYSLGLNKRIRTWLDLRRARPRSDGFHPSEHNTMCPMLEHYIHEANEDLASGDPEKIAAAFTFKHAVLEGRRFPGHLYMEFGVGDSIHEQVQFYMGALGYLWGVWQCPSCGAVTPEGFMPRTYTPDCQERFMLDVAPCLGCQGGNLRADYAWRYIEPSVGEAERARELRIDGHMDGDIRYQENGIEHRYVLEVKSINEAGFTGKRGLLPKPEHVGQASIYAWLKGIPHILFVYVNKNQVSNWKEIVVPVDMDQVRAHYAKIQATLQSRRDGQPPVNARICDNHLNVRARACPAVERCFNVKRVDPSWVTG
jgi:hypothetical protein